MGFRPAALAACMTTCGEGERRDEHLHAWPGGLGGLHDHLVLRQSSLDGIAPVERRSAVMSTCMRGAQAAEP